MTSPTQRALRDHADVLVIGGGGAALRAALAAHEADPQLSIVLATKGTLGASGVTATACSDRMAFHATLPETAPGGFDAWRLHADDIYTIGGHVSDADLADILASHSADAFAYLDALGVPWARRADGSVDQFLTDGSLYPRACYTGPYTANHIESALLARLREKPIRVLEHQMAGALLHDGAERIAGAILISEQDDTRTTMTAGAVILATGGAGQVFHVNVFPPDCTGDGYAMAYRAGAELVNLEFIQIGLCSVATGLACSGSMMRALPCLVDEAGNEFLADYMPELTPEQRYAVLFAKGSSWPVSERDASHRIDIAAAQEIASGRRIFLDYNRDPQGLALDRLPAGIHEWHGREKDVSLERVEMATPLARLMAINRPSVTWLAERGVDLVAGDRLEIAPAVQHFQGGIKIRTHGETTIPGLYAAGEAAGGQHGANRPGGNALLDSQVFGHIAGTSAARYARAHPSEGEADTYGAELALDALFAPGGLPAGKVMQEVREAMSDACSVHRTAAGLEALVSHLDALAQRGITRTGVPLSAAIEAANVLQAARLIALAALTRDESRGPHLRFEGAASLTPLARDEQLWQRYVVLRQSAAGALIECRDPVRPAGGDQQQPQ